MKDEENMEPDIKSNINIDINKEEAVANRLKELAPLDRQRNGITPEQVLLHAQKLKAQRRARRFKGVGIAVAALVLIAVGITLEVQFNPDSLVVMALRSTGIITENNGNVVIKDNDEGVDENTTERVEVHTTWEGVMKAKEDYPELLIPGYVPEGYIFDKLEINIGASRIRGDFYFSNVNASIIIRITPNISDTVLYDYDKTIESENGQQIFINTTEDYAAYSIVSDCLVSIFDYNVESEIIKIVNGFS